MPERCPHCDTTPAAFAEWQRASEAWQAAMDLQRKVPATLRAAATAASLAWERRQACKERHDGDE